jgi:hydroxymethylglutaryl-CoA lyase
MSLPSSVNIVEVGPRDGLQNEQQILDTAIKIDFINRLATTGLKTIEATSFVAPTWVPQLADASEVLQSINHPHGISFPVLVPNQQGLAKAIAAGATSVSVFTTASEKFSQKNTNCSVAESIARIEKIMLLAQQNNITVRGYISCTLGCPYEGEVPYIKTAELAKQLYELGCYQISLGDTIGIGTPLQAKKMIETVIKKLPVSSIAAHFHDTYGQALANIYAVLELGINTFDSSIAGLGGCPYANGASGNVATEDLVYMLDGMRMKTGVDLNALLAVSGFISNILGRKPTSKVAQAKYHAYNETRT